jgi:dipeptidyl aminopeptidase/acylaminoacyl peptidase
MKKMHIVRAALGALYLGSVVTASTGGLLSPIPASATTHEPMRLDAKLSPDGRWVAIHGSRGWSDETRGWIVPLENGVPIELRDVQPNGPQTLAWDEHNLLRVEVVNHDVGIPEMHWLQPSTGETVRLTRDRDAMREQVRAATAEWGTVSERHVADGRTLRIVRWNSERTHVDLESIGASRITLSTQPGSGFFTSTREGVTYLSRFDMVAGTERELVQTLAPDFDWRVSADGRKLLVSEGGLEPRARILDAASGTLLDGPWLATEPRWIEGCDGRYFAAVEGARRVLFDLLRDRKLDLGGDEGPWLEIVALEDGRFLVDNDREVALFNADFRRERGLFYAPPDTSVAAR